MSKNIVSKLTKKQKIIAIISVVTIIISSIGLITYSYGDIILDRSKQITTDTSWQNWPDIYENRIVWTDNRNGNLDIYYYDLNTGIEKQITSNPSDQLRPKIYGDYIAWTDYRNGGYPQGLYTDVIIDMPELDTDVFIYDLKTGEERQITKKGSNQTLADIWGDNVFFYDCSDNTTNLYYYDISKNLTFAVNNSGHYFSDISVYENRIVYGETRGPPKVGPLNTVNEDIFMFDIESGTDTQITTNPEQQTSPDIFGDYIVWNDWRYIYEDCVGDNYLYSLKSRKEIQLTSGRDVSYPKVSDQYVVYIQNDRHHYYGSENKREDDKIFAYRISDGHEFQVPLAKGAKYSLEIWGSKIVWADLRDISHGIPGGFGGIEYNTDIYLLDLNDVIEYTTCIIVIVIVGMILIVGNALFVKIRRRT